MKYRKLGNSGLKVSELCLGTMQFGWSADESQSHKILSAAYDAGINFIDTADIYSTWVAGNPGGVSESIIGSWMKKNDIPREKLLIATKVRGKMGEGPNAEGLSRGHIFAAVEGSLRRLGTDYIDLYQAHWFDADTPIKETLLAFADLIQQGKVRYIGCSNYPAWRLTEAILTAKHLSVPGYVSLQPHYNLVHRDEFERELAELCRNYGIGVVPYSPLAGGFLTGKYRPGGKIDSVRSTGVRGYFNDRNWRLLSKLEDIANSKGDVTISQISIAWLLANKQISSAIIGPRTLNQLSDNLGTVGLSISEDEIDDLKFATSWD
jgi:aryl-alcohol dehydrogenase-like predicted oxidoreductase